MKKNSMPLMKKIVLASIPLILGITVATTSILNLASAKDSESARAVEIANLVTTSELEMVKMSEALRGYLLNPENHVELERKNQADDNYGAAAERLGQLVDDNPELAALNKKMADYDANELDVVENKVGELIENKDPSAKDYYNTVYMKARAIQSENFLRLKKLASAESEMILLQTQQARSRGAYIAAALLVSSAIFGLMILFSMILSTVRKIRVVSTNLRQSSEALNHSSKDVSDSSANLSECATEQSASLAETAASLEQLTATVAKNTENAKQTADTADQSRAKVTVGQEAVTRMIRSMEEINESNNNVMTQVTKSNQQMGEIVAVIREIENKTKIINDIVFQTKLLSFNASVEAARAGESGKGFAVVAEEVGNLAQMSGSAAKEISDMLEASVQKVEAMVQDSTQRVEGLFAEGKRKVEAGVVIANQCGEVLGEIVSNVSSVTAMAIEISTASTEQSKGLSQINKAMQQLDEATQRNTETSEQTASAAVQLTIQSQNLEMAVSALVTSVEGGVEVEASPATAIQNPTLISKAA